MLWSDTLPGDASGITRLVDHHATAIAIAGEVYDPDADMQSITVRIYEVP